MIEQRVLDAATEAAEEERRAWRIVSTPPGYTVHDLERGGAATSRPLGSGPTAESFTRHFCASDAQAARFVARQCIRAALEAAEAARG